MWFLLTWNTPHSCLPLNFLLNKVNIWSGSCLSLYFPPVVKWWWDFTESDSVLYQLKVAQWAKEIIWADPSHKSALSSEITWGCPFSRLLEPLFSCRRKKGMPISASSPCYLSQHPPRFLFSGELSFVTHTQRSQPETNSKKHFWSCRILCVLMQSMVFTFTRNSILPGRALAVLGPRSFAWIRNQRNE